MSFIDLGKQLLESARLGETEEVRLLMTNGAPFTTDWLGTSPLHMAAQYGHLTTAEVLLRAGISRDARTKVDRTPLHVAAQEGHLDIVELLINHGAEIDACDMLKMTPLHWAVERGHVHTVKFLLKNGANVAAISKFEKTPFDIAEDHENSELVDLFVEHSTNKAANKLISPPKAQSTPVKIAKTSNPPAGSAPLPLVVKSEAFSNAAIKMSMFDKPAQVTQILSSVTNTAAINNHLAQMKPIAPKPVFLRANLTSIQKAATTTTTTTTAASINTATNVSTASSSDSDEGETNEQSSTSVLATLAALAEATAPNATISPADALHWLEAHGIQMLPTDNSTVVASALEGGQTVALTEAGKLALTFVKERQNLNNSAEVSSSVPEASRKVPIPPVTSSNQKVITIVADQNQLPSIISTSQPPIVVFSQPVSSNVVDSTPPLKKVKLSPLKKDNPKIVVNGNTSNKKTTEDEDTLKLKEELEKIKKQAELYKAQLVLKAHEAELYKKQLEKMQTQPRVNQ